MKHSRLKWSYAVMAAVALGCAGAAFGRDDEVWIKTVVEGQPFKAGHVLNQKDEDGVTWIENGSPLENVLLKFEEELRFDDHALYDTETLLLLGYRFCPYFSVYAGDRYMHERKDHAGKLRLENQPTLDLCFAAPEFWTLKFDFRSRIKRRVKSNAADYMRYRERLRVRTSWSVTDFRISPCASFEAFLSDKPHVSSSDSFDRLRSQIGLSFNPMPSVGDFSCNLYFMTQHAVKNHSRDWNPTNVFGIDFVWKF